MKTSPHRISPPVIMYPVYDGFAFARMYGATPVTVYAAMYDVPKKNVTLRQVFDDPRMQCLFRRALDQAVRVTLKFADEPKIEQPNAHTFTLRGHVHNIDPKHARITIR